MFSFILSVLVLDKYFHLIQKIKDTSPLHKYMVFIFLLFQIIFLFIPLFPSIYDISVFLQPLYNRENYYIYIDIYVYIYICFITEIILRVVQLFFLCVLYEQYLTKNQSYMIWDSTKIMKYILLTACVIIFFYCCFCCFFYIPCMILYIFLDYFFSYCFYIAAYNSNNKKKEKVLPCYKHTK